MIQLLVSLIVIGLLLYVVNLLPLDPVVKKIIQAVAICLIVIWLIYAFFPMGGWAGPLPHVHR